MSVGLVGLHRLAGDWLASGDSGGGVGIAARARTAVGGEWARSHALTTQRSDWAADRALGWVLWAWLDGKLGQAGAWDDTLLRAVHADTESLQMVSNTSERRA